MDLVVGEAPDLIAVEDSLASVGPVLESVGADQGFVQTEYVVEQ
jgi:hypothetical protein